MIFSTKKYNVKYDNALKYYIGTVTKIPTQLGRLFGFKKAVRTYVSELGIFWYDGSTWKNLSVASITDTKLSNVVSEARETYKKDDFKNRIQKSPGKLEN